MASESLALHYWQLLTGPAEQAYEALEEMLGTQEENEYLDFTLFFNRQHAEKRLAKSLCAFANSDGGVLVFGIRTEKTAEDVEKARELVPIPKVKTEAAWLKDRARTIADPPIDGLEVKTICPASLNGTGFIVCFAPGSPSAPHRSSNAAGNRSVSYTHLTLPTKRIV